MSEWAKRRARPRHLRSRPGLPICAHRRGRDALCGACLARFGVAMALLSSKERRPDDQACQHFGCSEGRARGRSETSDKTAMYLGSTARESVDMASVPATLRSCQIAFIPMCWGTSIALPRVLPSTRVAPPASRRACRDVRAVPSRSRAPRMRGKALVCNDFFSVRRASGTSRARAFSKQAYALQSRVPQGAPAVIRSCGWGERHDEQG